VAGASPACSSKPASADDLDVAPAQELLQLRQVAAVGGNGVARCAALECEVREEVRDCIHPSTFA